MSAIRLDMTMSLDGFVAGPDDRIGQEMGRGGFRLFDWLDDREGPGPNGEVYVAWNDYAANTIAFAKSLDGGATWSTPVVVAPKSLQFEIAIPAFSLDIPDRTRTVN